MLQSFVAMVRSVAVMSVVAMLLEYLMPEGALQKSIHMVVGTVFLMIIIQPIMALLGSA